MNAPTFQSGRASLVLLLVLSAALAFGACVDTGSGSGSANTPRTSVDAPIDQIDVITRESAPPGYTAHIVSGLPSGCAAFDKAVIERRDGNTIVIKVTNTMPSDKDVACTMIYGMHESNIDLGTGFVSKQTYTLLVNGESFNFTAQ